MISTRVIGCLVLLAFGCMPKAGPQIREDLWFFVAHEEATCVGCRAVAVESHVGKETVLIGAVPDLVVPRGLVDRVQVTSMVVGGSEIWVVHAFLKRPGRRLLYPLLARNPESDVVVSVGSRPTGVERGLLVGSPLLIGTFLSWEALSNAVDVKASEVSENPLPEDDFDRRSREIDEAAEDLL